MLSKGDELYDSRFGERYLVLEAARDNGGELVRIQDTTTARARTSAVRDPGGRSQAGRAANPADFEDPDGNRQQLGEGRS